MSIQTSNQSVVSVHGESFIKCPVLVSVNWTLFVFSLEEMLSKTDTKALNQEQADHLRWIARTIEIRLKEKDSN